MSGLLENGNFEDDFGHVLTSIHSKEQCKGQYCVIHNPKPSHMQEWPLLWRADRAIFERTDPLGCGHPDPSQYEFWDSVYGKDNGMSIHGCNGLCNEDKWNEYKESCKEKHG